MLNSAVTSWAYDYLYDKNKFMCYFCMEYHCRDCMVQDNKDLETLLLNHHQNCGDSNQEKAQGFLNKMMVPSFL
jgi:hypothetical protein